MQVCVDRLSYLIMLSHYGHAFTTIVLSDGERSPFGGRRILIVFEYAVATVPVPCSAGSHFLLPPS
jgi:hypothetical protein